MVWWTCASSSDGAAPNCETATDITEMSALGSRVTASLVKADPASTSRMIEKTIEGSGFRIDHARCSKPLACPVRSSSSANMVFSGRRHAARCQHRPRRFADVEP